MNTNRGHFNITQMKQHILLCVLHVSYYIILYLHRIFDSFLHYIMLWNCEQLVVCNVKQVLQIAWG
jgi:hypothetical protein